jgi:hypothetical protein
MFKSGQMWHAAFMIKCMKETLQITSSLCNQLKNASKNNSNREADDEHISKNAFCHYLLLEELAVGLQQRTTLTTIEHRNR